jgi:hypothetical protein
MEQTTPQAVVEVETPVVVEIQTRQVGLIMYGGGIDKNAWIENAKRDGFIVKEFEGHAELHVEVKKK